MVTVRLAFLYGLHRHVQKFKPSKESRKKEKRFGGVLIVSIY